MIRQLAQAIYQKFNNSASLKSALKGGLYFQRAPQNATSPWCVFQFIGSSDSEVMGTADDNLRESEIQFSLFSTKTDGGSEIAVLTEKLSDVFDWCILSLEGFANYKCQRTVLGALLYTNEIWQSTISYEIGVYKE